MILETRYQACTKVPKRYKTARKKARKRTQWWNHSHQSSFVFQKPLTAWYRSQLRTKAPVLPVGSLRSLQVVPGVGSGRPQPWQHLGSSPVPCLAARTRVRTPTGRASRSRCWSAPARKKEGECRANTWSRMLSTKLPSQGVAGGSVRVVLLSHLLVWRTLSRGHTFRPEARGHTLRSKNLWFGTTTAASALASVPCCSGIVTHQSAKPVSIPGRKQTNTAGQSDGDGLWTSYTSQLEGRKRTKPVDLLPHESSERKRTCGSRHSAE